MTIRYTRCFLSHRPKRPQPPQSPPAASTPKPFRLESPGLHKALTTLEFLSRDKRTRALCEGRQKTLMTYTADMEGAREEGEQIGMEKRTKEIAPAMLADGDSMEKVMTITGLTHAEVEALKAR